MKEKTMEQLAHDARSILKVWEQENAAKIRQYAEDHHWLQQDMDKLWQHIRREKLVTVAITRHNIYGRTASGMLYTCSRSSLGIGENWSRPREGHV